MDKTRGKKNNNSVINEFNQVLTTTMNSSMPISTAPISKNNTIIIDENQLFNLAKTGRKSKKNNDSMFDEDIFQKAGAKNNQVKANKNEKSTIKNNKIIEESNDDIKYQKNGYTRPEVTYTDQLSKEQIEKKLEDYKKVDDIYKVPLGVHLRYFSNIDGQMVFRMGGQLHKNTGLPAYVILTNGKNQWSVQVKDTIFYRKMVLQEIKEEYEKIINDLLIKNKKLKDKLNNK